MRIRTQYALATSALTGLVLALTAVSVAHFQRELLVAQAAQRQEALMEGVARLAQEALAGRDQLMLLSYLQSLQQHEKAELGPATVVWGGHTVVLGQEEPGLTTLERRVAAGNGSPGAESLTATVRLGFRSSAVAAGIDRSLKPFIRTTALLAGAAVLLGALGAAALARLLTRPIMDMSAAVASVSRGDLDVVVPERGGEEVARLAKLFNQMTARLRELNQFKADLLHTLTHELNNPLMGLSSHLQVMKDRPAAARADLAQTAATMLGAVNRMSESLSNTLQLFAAEHGAQKRGALAPVDFSALLVEACRLFASMAEAKRVRLEPPQAPPGARLDSDPDLVRQILNNLLSNALKYTPEGGRVSAGLLVRPTDIALWVTDTGVGVPKNRLDNLFKRFDRTAGAQGVAQRVSGVGLGLSIVANAVAALHGQVKVDSVEGKGTTFWVVLPKQKQVEAV